MTDTVETQLAALTERLQRVEDELAVHRLIVRYALAVDAGEAEAAMALFTEDTVYEVGAVGTGMDGETSRRLIMPGRDAVGKMVTSDAHQALLPKRRPHRRAGCRRRRRRPGEGDRLHPDLPPARR